MKIVPSRLPLLLCCLALGGPLAAARAADSSVLDMVPRDAAAFMHVRVAELWKSDAFKGVRDFFASDPQTLGQIEARVGFRPADVKSVTLVVPQAGSRELAAPVVIVRTLAPYDKKKLLTTLKTRSLKSAVEQRFEDGPPTVDLGARTFLLNDMRGIMMLVDDRTAVFTSPRRADAAFDYLVRMLKRADKGPLDGALAEAAKNHAIVGGLDVETFANSLPHNEVPHPEKTMGLFAAKAAILTVDVKDELSLALSIDVAVPANAKRVEESLRSTLNLIKDSLPGWRREAKQEVMAATMKMVFDQIEAALGNAKIEARDSMVRLKTSVKADQFTQAALKAAIVEMQQAAARTTSTNNLKQIGLATHAFHDANGFLPFPGLDGAQADVNAKLSWRVALLPFIEQQNLYNQFHLNEAWDSEHNKKLIPLIPKTYAPPPGIEAPKGHTFYRTFVGPDTISTPPLTLIGIQDGTSNTVMAAEGADAVPWTKPDELPYDAKKPLPKLGGMFNGNFHVLLADGSVRFIPKQIPEKQLRALITPNGGEVIDWSWLK